MALKLLGYWKAYLDDAYPCPQELEGELASPLRERLIRYLEEPPPSAESGCIRQGWGPSWCRYGCERSNGSRELSDGVWLWPSGLSHYVREHGVGLFPDEFLARVAGDLTEPAPPSTPDNADRIDESLWIAWGSKYRTAAFAAALDELRERALVARNETLDVDAGLLSRALGVTESLCVTEGCTRHALSNRTVCARCYLAAISLPSGNIGYQELRSLLKVYPFRPRLRHA